MLNYTEYRHKTATEWVTFVHGAGGSSSIWFKQIRSFSTKFNVLILDLRGHGASKLALKDTFNDKYTFDAITQDIVEVIDHLKIKQSHFAGISLGTILIRNLAEKYPERVKSMIMGGAIMQLNLKSQILMKVGVLCKSVVPYLLLYKLFAFIIMPRKNHKKSRLIFVNEAKKLYQKEFIRWFKLTAEINPLLHFFRTNDIKIPTFYIMGEEDHLFLPAIKKVVTSHLQASLLIIKNCGHVVNIEQADTFNTQSIDFIERQSLA
ncbi:Pimeloyl-ACP methyl ester carboxylesterase [Lutibacter agarilyticus]|uniref:Pimeloyl-ACP methyl ester carboxylesterase n=1 Tax=Lutibacter agarilyticus TaxID=1109740 RepID=A0A238XX09_9FLAO|nr:alpha/beta hydrolase [Lutibacter agarilyticus]SNR63535.1 Pimeloyl-ACP methyl ester carboxylesterase [Lutibacter agarilyticus]